MNLNGLELFYNTNEIGKPPVEEKIFKIHRIYTDNPDPTLKSYKLLGIYFDEYLSFEKHIQILCSKLSRSLFFLRQVKNYINPRAAKMLYYSLFHSHLLYCTIITSCASKTLINKISVLQKRPLESLIMYRTMNILNRYLENYVNLTFKILLR